MLSDRPAPSFLSAVGPRSSTASRRSPAEPVPAPRARRTALFAGAVLCTVFQDRAVALVGGAQVAKGDIARQVVMVNGTGGMLCTGTLLARDIVLTAAHCAADATALTVSRNTAAGTEADRVIAFVVHPQYDAWNYARSQAAVDLALLKLEVPLRGPAPVTMRRRVPLPGERFVVAGFGVTGAGSLAGLGTLQTATLVTVGAPSSLQLRLVDPASAGGTIAGLGSCYGDSGGPVFERNGGRFVLIGVLSWSNGPNMSAGCGGLTGATPLARHRDWLLKTMAKMGGRVIRSSAYE